MISDTVFTADSTWSTWKHFMFISGIPDTFASKERRASIRITEDVPQHLILSGNSVSVEQYFIQLYLEQTWKCLSVQVG